jgi:hypothetical protein
MAPELTNPCPPQEPAASTTANEEGFVEASPSRALRDGEGMSLFNPSHQQDASATNSTSSLNCKEGEASNDL